MKWCGRKTLAPLVVDSIDEGDLRASREDSERVRRETRAIQTRIRGQWPEVMDRLTFTQERLERNDIAGAIERGSGFYGGERHA